jgi:hypothetical protein
LEAREKALGCEHVYTLASVNSLGSVREQQGNHTEAEATHRQVFGAQEKMLEHEHPDTLMSTGQIWRGGSDASTGSGREGESAWTRAS